MISLDEQVDLEKYSPVCVKPDDEQSDSASSERVIAHQVIGEQPKKLKQAHLKGWVILNYP